VPPSINLRRSAIRKLVAEAAKNELLDRSVTQGIVSTQERPPIRRQGRNWLTPEQARDLLAQPEIETTEGKRDQAILAVPFGLRPAPERARGARVDAHPAARRPLVFVDLVGKGKRIRTVPIPPFVKVAIDAWTAAAGRALYFGGCVVENIRRRRRKR
jgi:integrase